MTKAREKMKLGEAEFLSEVEAGLWESADKNDLVNTAATGLDYILRSFASSSSNTQLLPRIKGWFILDATRRSTNQLFRGIYDGKP